MPEARNPREPLLIALLSSVAVCLLALGIRSAGGLEDLDLALYDHYAGLRVERAAVDPRILVVEITEDDIRTLGRWPLSDGTLARLITTLTQLGARAIGLDTYRDLEVPPGIDALRASFRDNPRAVAVFKFGDEPDRVPPPPFVTHQEQIAFSDIIVDDDGTVRRGLLFLDDGELVSYSLALRLALLYLGDEGVQPEPDAADPSVMRLGAAVFAPFSADDGGYVRADDRGYQFLLNASAPVPRFASVSLIDLLEGSVDREQVRDRIVLVGVTAQSLPDFFHVAFNAVAEGSQKIPGVRLHARLTSQIIGFALGASEPPSVTSESAEVAAIVVLGLLGGAIGFWLRGAWSFPLALVGGLLALWLLGYAAHRQGLWLPLVGPALANLGAAVTVVAYRSSRERAARTLVMNLFARHVSKDVAQQVWRERDRYLKGGRPRSQRLTATVLFVDMKGYTARSEQMDPAVLMEWVNDFMEAMARGVIEYGGFIDDYFGDGLKACFGVPFGRPPSSDVAEDARQAVRCALDLESRLDELNGKWLKRGLPTVAMRVGIATGPVVGGSLGSADRLKYTLVGDTVVVAQRLEGLDEVKHDFEERPCRILVTEETRSCLDGVCQSARLGEFRLKGRGQPVTVHSVVESGRAASGLREVV